MRRPFAEVVAGSKATNAAFPPLQQRKLPVLGSEKGIKQKIARVRSEKQINIVDDLQESQISENISSARDSSNVTRADSFSDGNSSSQMRSKAVPATMSDGGKIKTSFSPKHVIVYVGFEHECSYGHRFLLNSEHLNELGPLYSLPEEMQASSSIKCSDGEATDSINISKNRANEKVLPRSNGLVTAINNVRPLNKLKQKMATGNQHWDGWDGFSSFSTSENEHNQFSNGLSSRSKSFNDLEEKLQQVSLDDSASAFSLLNRNLPVYMNCPHCRVSKRKDQQKAKFASTVSQLQRIFLVSCLPPSVVDREWQSQFSMGCRVILPPDSFLTLRLPFVYGVQLEDRSSHPLNYLEHQPELTAWITKGTALEVMLKESSLSEDYHLEGK